MVRLARAADETAVVALWRACGLATETNDPAADFRFALAGPASAVLAWDDAEAIVAAAMVGHDGHRGWLYYVAVAPSHRGRGLGRGMVAAAEAWLRERGVPKAQLLIRETNTQVAAFYERLGYAAIPRTVMQKGLR